MSKIIYKPHCSKCGFPIDTSEEEIAYQDIYEGCGYRNMLKDKVYTNIYPRRCSHCGEYFECIEITPPKKMPDMFIDEEGD